MIFYVIDTDVQGNLIDNDAAQSGFESVYDDEKVGIMGGWCICPDGNTYKVGQ
jgi:hypothetical protein